MGVLFANQHLYIVSVFAGSYLDHRPSLTARCGRVNVAAGSGAKEKLTNQSSTISTRSVYSHTQCEEVEHGTNVNLAIRHGSWFYLFLIVIYTLSVIPAGSEALNSTRALADIQVRSKGENKNVLLIPSEFEPEKWYYATSTLHFGQREIAGQGVPQMTLLRYQRRDPENPNKYMEGATLQLAIDIDPLDDSAKKSLLRKAKAAAENWEKEHYQTFSSRLEEEANKAGANQWQDLYDSYRSARNKDLNARSSKNLDAVLEKALSDGLDDWAIFGLEESKRLLRMCHPVSLASLPIASTQLSLYDGTGQVVDTFSPTRGAAPEYATKTINYTLELGKYAADISEALLTSQTGIFMVLRRDYEVLSAPLAYKIVINYDKALQEYRRNSDTVEQAVLFASYQLPDSAEKEKKAIVERFERDILKAYARDGDPVSLASIDTKTLQALVGRINRELLQEEWAQKSVNLKTLSPTKKSQSFDIQSLSVPAVRDSGPVTKDTNGVPAVNVQRNPPEAAARGGTETLLPGYRYREHKSVITQGFLSIVGYDQSVRDVLLVDEPSPEWEYAYFLLPGVGDDPQIGVRRVVTKIVLRIKNRSWREQTTTWEIGKGWTLADGKKPRAWGILSFPLEEARQEFGEAELQKSEFHIDQEIRCALGKLYTLSSSYTVNVFDGKSMIAAPLECVQPVIFDLSNFRWNTPEYAFYSSQITITQRLKPGRPLILRRNVSPGRELIIAPVRIDPMAELDVGAISAKVGLDARYRDDQGRPRRKALWWNLNDENLVELYPALFVSIFNDDWIK